MSQVTKREADQSFLQLALFRTEDCSATNYAALYDLAPRYVLYQSGQSRILEPVKRTFTFGDQTYRVVLKPARIEGPDGVTYDVFPGEREQLVEDVIRNRASLRINDNEVVTEFYVHHIIKELARLKHTLNRTEIQEALQILHLSNIMIQEIDTEDETSEKRRRGKSLIAASAFPVIGLRDEADDENPSYVQLNPLLAQSIRSLSFTQVDYDWMMTIRSAFARWVFKRLSIQIISGGDAVLDDGVVRVSAIELATNWGQVRQQHRDTLRQVSAVIDKLVDAGVFEEVRKEPVLTGRRKDDEIYEVVLSKRFILDRRRAISAREFGAEQARLHPGHSEGFVRIEPSETTRIRGRKRAAGKQLTLEVS